MKQLLMKRLMLSLLAVLMPLGLLAQEIKVQGVVKDQTGEAVIGATVMQKGTSNGTVTDFDGNFSLSVPSKATLVISAVTCLRVRAYAFIVVVKCLFLTHIRLYN